MSIRMCDQIMFNRRDQAGKRAGQKTSLSMRQRIWKTLMVHPVQLVRNGAYHAVGYFYAARR